MCRFRRAVHCLALLSLFLVVLVSTARAQETYVGGALVGDIVRASGSDDIGSGEAFGGSLRVGTGISSRWGVDLEFVRPGKIESDLGSMLPLADTSPIVRFPSGFTPGPGIDLPVDPGDLRLILPASASVSSRYTTLSAMAWARQSIGDRVELMYLGGVAFARVDQTSVYRITWSSVFPSAPADLVVDNDYSSYEAGPSVGLDTRVRMTDHLRLTAGVRLVALDTAGRSAWLTRPSVGLHWIF
jgi:hypothetical protein